MANYCIMRMEKAKDVRSAGARLKHMRRELPCSTLRHQGEKPIVLRCGSVGECMNRPFGEIFRERTDGQNIRKNAVYAVELVLTFSPGAIKTEQMKEWAGANVKWMSQLFGSQNIIGAYLHLDEETPHIHAMVIPIDERGKLNAKAFLGGTSQRMRDLQTDYAKEMARFGLERGVDKKITKARHKSTATWRAEQADKQLELETYEKLYGKPQEMDLNEVRRFFETKNEIANGHEAAAERLDLKEILER